MQFQPAKSCGIEENNSKWKVTLMIIFFDYAKGYDLEVQHFIQVY